MRFAAILMVCLITFTACSRKSESPTSPQTQTPISPAAQSVRNSTVPRLTREEFFANLYERAYRQFGRKSSNWDKSAEAFLQITGTGAAQNKPSDLSQIAPLVEDLQKSGCNDPLVNYLILRQTLNPYVSNENSTNDWVQTSFAFDQTEYHPYWKFFSRVRAAESVKSVSGVTNSALVIQLRNDAAQRLVKFLSDASLPESIVYDAVNTFLTDIESAPKLYTWTFTQIEPLLQTNWGDTAEAGVLIGRGHIKLAWNERGGGYADSVTPQGWAGFASHLQSARSAFEKSWSIKPTEEAATEMLTVVLGEDNSRSEMERWFERAMQLNPANYDACLRKLNYLTPRWHGSSAELLAFGRQCLTNRTWKGLVPLTLYQAHREIVFQEKAEGRDPDRYWRRREVWSDVRSSFVRFFELCPDNVGWHHDYALVAYKARAWPELNQQLALLGAVNYEFFGGKDAFDKIVAEASAHR